MRSIGQSFVDKSFVAREPQANTAHYRYARAPREKRSDAILASSLALLPARASVEAWTEVLAGGPLSFENEQSECRPFSVGGKTTLANRAIRKRPLDSA